MEDVQHAGALDGTEVMGRRREFEVNIKVLQTADQMRGALDILA